MIVIIGGKRLKVIMERLEDLERRANNVEVEVFSTVAEMTMPGKPLKRRITLNGIIRTLFKKVMGIKGNKLDAEINAAAEAEKESVPLIHRV
jgi:tetrahydromethanopterin S-methyltransferase subunit G